MKKGFFLQTVGQMQRGAVVSGVGFLLYLGASALKWELAAGMIAIAFAVAAVYVFLSMLARSGGESGVTYSLIWGQGALTLLLGACAVLNVKLWMGL